MDYYAILFHQKNDDRLPLKGDFYECLFAGTVGWKTVTIDGVPPIYFVSDGTALTAYEISGNMTQDGTPTQTNPIYPTECGDRTISLINPDTAWASKKVSDGVYSGTILSFYSLPFTIPENLIGKTLTVRCYVSGSLSGTNIRFRFTTGSTNTDSSSIESSGYLTLTFTPLTNTDTLRIYYGSGGNRTIDISEFMINEGSVPLTYEPYGKYKLPLNLNDNVQNWYLSEPIRKIGNYADVSKSVNVVVKRIVKKTLRGTDPSWESVAEGSNRYYRLGIGNYGYAIDSVAMCSHLVRAYITSQNTNVGCNVLNSSTTNKAMIFIRLSTSVSLSDFKNWLEDQYTNGTPVVLYYVLSTPTTVSVDSPTLTPTAGNNTLSVGTTLQPSNVSITGRIKPTTP